MKNFLKSKYFIHYSLSIILLLGAILRLYGLNWDQNQHLHPDERFLTMVTQAISWPQSLPDHLDPSKSPANPYNAGYSFFVYGTLPMYLGKAASQILRFNSYDYNNVTLVGRILSAIFDLGTLVLVFLITKKLSNSKFEIQSSKQILNSNYQNSKGKGVYVIPLLATFIYAISVLPIQLSHFYAVDTFLVFFITLSFYLLIKQYAIRNTQYAVFLSTSLGIAFGLALACKITALLFLPIISIGLLIISFTQQQTSFKQKISSLLASHFLILISAYLALRIADPRIFATSNIFNPTINSQFIRNLTELKSFNHPETWFPPSIQWIKTKPIVFPLKNMILWGLGIPLGVLAIGGIFYSLWLNSYMVRWLATKRFKNFNYLTIQQFSHFLIILWVLLLFLFQATRFAKAMRYFYPIYPFLAILAGQFLYQCVNTLIPKINRRIVPLFYCSIVLLLLLWPLSFVSIYSRPHPRVMASEWIYKNIPPGSTISCEHWDDCLPLGLDGKSASFYQTEILELYAQDTPEKWQKINQQLAKIDYLILSSNRLWASIPKVPEKYPITTKFYQDLFAEKLNFKKATAITSYPKLPHCYIVTLLHCYIDDSFADESFTVYDHPKVIIFKKTEN